MRIADIAAEEFGDIEGARFMAHLARVKFFSDRIWKWRPETLPADGEKLARAYSLVAADLERPAASEAEHAAARLLRDRAASLKFFAADFTPSYLKTGRDYVISDIASLIACARGVPLHMLRPGGNPSSETQSATRDTRVVIAALDFIFDGRSSEGAASVWQKLSAIIRAAKADAPRDGDDRIDALLAMPANWAHPGIHAEAGLRHSGEKSFSF